MHPREENATPRSTRTAAAASTAASRRTIQHR